MQDTETTPTVAWTVAAAQVIGWVQSEQGIKWLEPSEDGQDDLREGTLRGWSTWEDDVRDRKVRITTRTGWETEREFQALVRLVLSYEIATR